MIELSNQELEGRLNAHRELMIDLLAAFMGGQNRMDEFLRRLSEDASFKDHEEDPGIVPSEGIAIQNAAASEIRSILEAARARCRAVDHA